MSAPFTDLEINARAQLSLLEAVRDINPEAIVLFARLVKSMSDHRGFQ
jgi:hypothetical protein